MRSGISLRADFAGADLQRLARQTKDAAQARRLLALALIYDGGSRSDAARLGNVTLQIVRDWVMRFNERGPQGLINGKAPGQQSRLNDQQRAALAQAIERGPTPYLDGVVRWRLCDLAYATSTPHGFFSCSNLRLIYGPSNELTEEYLTSSL
ncbi:helix-turn-helix domain-containing protein [Ensifer sp. 22460]|uniref:helix-turn-helix domain-containing protein n=1 Tax=Ensifer sp. 22460 TaxID=3453922 RepID=UPI003F83F335